MHRILFGTLLFTVMAHTEISVEYTLSMPHPSNHLFEVGMTVHGLTTSTVDFHMPAWRTGRYVIQDFSGGVQEFSASDEKGNLLAWIKVDKDTWRISRGRARSITAAYKVYANEFNQRTRELNGDHGFLDPAAVFMYVDDVKRKPLQLTIRPYGTWHVTTGLAIVEGATNVFRAPHFEYFADCPIEIGHQQDFEFTVDGKQHIISFYGNGNWQIEPLIRDVTSIITANKNFWGTLPYEKYLFLIHCQPNARGGTEHINSTVLGVRPFIFSHPSSYASFLGLVSHEYFHTWNVKQLRPKAFAPYDFSKENYSEELWISEGSTSYFDDIILLHAGIRDAQSYLGSIGQMIRTDRERYGNKIQSLAESSFDAWVKYWRRKPNAANAESDYYGKGQHVSLLLDLEIRHRSNNTHSLETVMKAMFERYPLSKGFTNNDFIAVCEEFAGSSLMPFFDHYLYGTSPLPWEQTLGYAGLDVIRLDSVMTSSVGISVDDGGGKTIVTSVQVQSPAENAGIELNDEIIAIDGFRVRAAEFNDRISSLSAGDTIRITCFRNDKLKDFAVTVQSVNQPLFRVQKKANPTALQKRIFEDWLKGTF